MSQVTVQLETHYEFSEMRTLWCCLFASNAEEMISHLDFWGYPLEPKDRALLLLPPSLPCQGDDAIREMMCVYLPSECKKLERSLDMPIADAVVFRQSLFGDIPQIALLVRMLTACQNVGTVWEEVAALLIRIVRNQSYLFYKYELPSTEKNEQVINKFISDEVRVANSHLPSSSLNRAILRRARGLIGRILGGLNPDDIRVHDGPGAVSEGVPRGSKPELRYWDSRLSEFWSAIPFVWGWTEISEMTCGTEQTEGLTSKVYLVPKDARGPRLISAEPRILMFFQQGLEEILTKRIESHPLTRNHVRFSSQEPNRHAALKASLGNQIRVRPPRKAGSGISLVDSTMATVDMRDASDRISLELVSELFSPTRFGQAMIACRSTHTMLPSGDVVKLAKFAPMGNGLTFPTEALCFWSVIVAWALELGLASHKEVPKLPIHVFGDDIIVPSVWVEDLRLLFGEFGWEVNINKTFYSTPPCKVPLFRESCGMDAWGGHCVTPTRLSQRCLDTSDPNKWEFCDLLKGRLFKRREALLRKASALLTLARGLEGQGCLSAALSVFALYPWILGLTTKEPGYEFSLPTRFASFDVNRFIKEYKADILRLDQSRGVFHHGTSNQVLRVLSSERISTLRGKLYRTRFDLREHRTWVFQARGYKKGNDASYYWYSLQVARDTDNCGASWESECWPVKAYVPGSPVRRWAIGRPESGSYKLRWVNLP